LCCNSGAETERPQPYDPPPQKKEITDPHTPDFEVLDKAVAGGFYQDLGRVVVDAVAYGGGGGTLVG